MQNRGNDVEEEPHPMLVIVLLILSASAIATPPSEPSSLDSNTNRGNDVEEEPQRGNKNTNFKVEVTHAKQKQRCRSGDSLDVGNRLVDLERLGDRDATLGAELVVIQTAKEGVSKKGMIGMLLPSR
jgi:hypothetical protein